MSSYSAKSLLEEGTGTARGELPPCHEQSDGGGFLQDSHRMVSEHEFGKKP